MSLWGFFDCESQLSAQMILIIALMTSRFCIYIFETFYHDTYLYVILFPFLIILLLNTTIYMIDRFYLLSIFLLVLWKRIIFSFMFILIGKDSIDIWEITLTHAV